MITLLHNDDVNNYKLYSSASIIQNMNQLKFDSNKGYNNFTKMFGNTNNWPKANNATYGYTFYNVFQLTSGSIAFYKVLQDLKQVVIEYLKGSNENTDHLWFQAWLNYHSQNEVLDWHRHYDSTCHGYIAIDPKNSITEFRNFSIENKIGQIYIGPIGLEHRVIVNEPYTGKRITIGFDVSNKELSFDKKNFGWLPLL